MEFSAPVHQQNAGGARRQRTKPETKLDSQTRQLPAAQHTLIEVRDRERISLFFCLFFLTDRTSVWVRWAWL